MEQQPDSRQKEWVLWSMCVDDGVVADDDATCVLKSDSCLGPFVPVIQ